MGVPPGHPRPKACRRLRAAPRRARRNRSPTRKQNCATSKREKPRSPLDCSASRQRDGRGAWPLGQHRTMTAEQAAKNIRRKIDELALDATNRMDALADVDRLDPRVRHRAMEHAVREVLVDFLLGQ